MSRRRALMIRAERWYRLSPAHSQDYCFGTEAGYRRTAVRPRPAHQGGVTT